MSGRIVLLAGIWTLAACSADVVSAAEVVVKNDSTANGTPSTICNCFTPMDEAAAWLTSPCDGAIVAVQVFWNEIGGSGSTLTEEEIRIHAAGAFPVPGAVLTASGAVPAVVQLPMMAVNTMNEFRFLDPSTGMTTPLDVAVADGQTFVVTLKFLNTNDVSGPSTTSDQDGCQSARNAVFIDDLAAWSDFCPLGGMTGDWVIRAVVDCDEPGPVPTMSQWGLAVLFVLLMTAGTLVFAGLRRRHAAARAVGHDARRR